MLKVSDLYMPARDLKALKHRIEYLTKRVEEKTAAGGENAPGTGFDRAELGALKRLVSQIDDKGVHSIEAHHAKAVTPGVETYRGWLVLYGGRSKELPWKATKGGDDSLYASDYANLKSRIDICIEAAQGKDGEE